MRKSHAYRDRSALLLIARNLTLELAAESRAFCEKYGIAADARRHKDCVSDLQVIRDKQSERTNRDMGFEY